MEINSLDITPTSTCDSILKHIINCANCSLKNEDAFQKAMLGLASELRRVFDSEYCSIGIVDGDFVEECVIAYKKFEDEELSKQQEIVLNSVKRVNVHNEDKYIVCQALKSDTDIFLHKEKTGNIINNEYYQSILTSGHVKNSYVIPLRDKEKKNFGFIQFINTERTIDYDLVFLPYKDALLGLVQIIINNKKNHQEIVKKHNLLRDADFYNLMQEKRDNVDELLDSIMEYFSKEFNAAIVSFRIPILNGYQKEPLFYLRSAFVHPSIKLRDELKQRYFSERLVKNKEDMRVVYELRCDDQGKILESISDTDFSQFNLSLDRTTLIIPIFRDFEAKYSHSERECIRHTCSTTDLRLCKVRFKRLYGVFRLRISKTDFSNPDNPYLFEIEETIERLAYLSKQISLLLNSIVNRFENNSLIIFQDKLKNSSFIKIKDFDERCVEIINNSVHAKVCSIYRYDDQTKLLTLSATTAKIIKFNTSGQTLYIKTQQIKDSSCFIHIKDKNNLLARAYLSKRCEYVLNIYDTALHQSAFIEFIESVSGQETAMAIPMIKKDGTCAGVVLLLGKKYHRHSISTTYWEHDIKHIEFIVRILTRISESYTEKLSFFSQLSHELLAPVTEMVYDNDFIVNLAHRNQDSISRNQLVSKLQNNIDKIMLFKYIIGDSELIYSSNEWSIGYNIVRHERPQSILLYAIRLLENEAYDNELSIKTNISHMPPLYFDKDRMMQVFLNILKNAIRYSDSHTTIEISYTNNENSFHEIRFANYGIGIKEDEKERVFELFQRGEEARNKYARGTGIGLYIVQQIMRAHKGECYIRRLNDPTEFSVVLPNR